MVVGCGVHPLARQPRRDHASAAFGRSRRRPVTFDINAIPLVKRLSHLPVIGDPSHATGKWYPMEPVGLASIAAGADGLIIEVHPNPTTHYRTARSR